MRTKALYKHAESEDQPLISVITVVYNNVALLEQTIQSVINQHGDRVEYIVIDGGSTDGTVELIRQYEKQIDYWVSEKDGGIYDAMNKGLALASSDWVWCVNSDDMIFPRDFELKIGSDSNAFVGKSLIAGKFCNWIRPNKLYDNISEYSHQSFIFRKKYKFDQFLKVGSDTLLMRKYEKFQIESSVLSVFRIGGVSSKVSLDNVIESFLVNGVKGGAMMTLKAGLIFLFKERIEYFQMLKSKIV